jgi:hypothetical protein
MTLNPVKNFLMSQIYQQWSFVKHFAETSDRFKNMPDKPMQLNEKTSKHR